MSTVELRPRRRDRVRPGREIQGLFAMPEEESGTEPPEIASQNDRAQPPAIPRPPALAPTRTHRGDPRGRRGAFPPPGNPGPVPLPHRLVLAAWPDAWRERWGRRANALEELGLSWRDAEGRAFLEVWNQWRGQADVVRHN